MNRSDRFCSILLTLTLAACNARAAENHIAPLQDAGLRFMVLLNSAKRGDIAKQIEVAQDYLIGYGVHQDARSAAQWYEKAARAGDPDAQNQIGYLNQIGLGVPRNLQRAAHWYRLSATNGSETGKVNLAIAYLWGIGVQPDPELGAALLGEASERGSGLAAAYLGDLYAKGIGVAPDADRAIACFERGVKLHNYFGEYKLGLYLSDPQGSPRNLQRSVALLRSSAAHGYIPAMYAFGLLAVSHPESGILHEEALDYLNFAADSGWWKASAVLAIIARDGKWKSRSMENAYRYFKRATVQGGKEAKDSVENDLLLLSGQLDEYTIASLDEEVNEWTAHHSTRIELIHKGERSSRFLAEYALTIPDPGEHAPSILPSLAD